MALWFDAKGKSYAGDHTSSWLKAYVEQELEKNARQSEENVQKEEEARIAADKSLHAEIEQEKTECAAAMEEEASSRQAEDGKLQTALSAHRTDEGNPHGVTKAQVGLGNAENTSDLDKPVSTATQAAVNAEKAARENADTVLQSKIDTETTARTAADAELQERTTGISQRLQKEIEDRTEVLTQMGERHEEFRAEFEELRETDNELAEALRAAAQERDAADAQLHAAIDTETSARTAADTALETAVAQKVDTSAVLTKTNTEVFVPSGNYQPATKKYVDDSVSAAGGGDMLKSVYDADNDGKVNSAEVADNADKLGGQLPSYYATASAVNAKASTSAVLTKTNTVSFTPTGSYHPATKKYVDDSVSGKVNSSAVLTKTNTASFTPTGSYHPATKKYVDDAVASAVVFPEKPALTALTPVGTTVGSSGWTGTGEFNTNASANNSHNVFSGFLGSGYMRLNLKLAEGEDWRDWAPYYDKDGEEFPLYYSEARGVYDGVIPDEGLALQQTVNKVRWVYRRRPDIMIYGSVGGIMQIRSTANDDGTTTETFSVPNDPGILNLAGTGNFSCYTYVDNGEISAKSNDARLFMYNMMVGKISLAEIPKVCAAKILIASDVTGDGRINATDSSRVYQMMVGTVSKLPICDIDNWGA